MREVQLKASMQPYFHIFPHKTTVKAIIFDISDKSDIKTSEILKWREAIYPQEK